MKQLGEVFGRLREQIATGNLGAEPATCSRCDKPPRPGQRYCRGCHTEYVREWRRAHGGRSGMTQEARRRDNARSYAGTNRRRGKLIPGTCVDCGSAQVEMHHEDYAKPIAVVWLCRPCHLARHRASR